IVRSVPYDVPLDTRHIDIAESDVDPAELAGELCRAYDETPILVALRDGQRWVPDYQVVPVPAPADPSAGLRKRGVYLVTGGTGGLGLTIAEDLARRVRARLVLVARSPLPPRDEWDTHLAAHGATGRVGQSIVAIRRMEAAGATVLPLAADVTDVAALRAVRAAVLDRFGRIDGIIHTAGIAGGGVTETRPREAMLPVLLPKLTGTLALRTVFGNLDLDSVMLFSSATGVVGGLGEVDYSAANAYLDAHAQSTGAWRAPVRSLGWAGWRDVGMLAAPDAAAPAPRPAAGVTSMDHPLLEERWVAPDGATVCAGTISAGTHWFLNDHRIDGVPVLPATAQLDAIYAAATAALDAAGRDPGAGRAFEFSEVLFMEPLAVPDGTTAQVKVTVRNAGDRHEATVTSPAGGLDRIYCRALVRWVDPPSPAAVDLAAARARCESRPDLVEISHRLDGGLVEYGPRWRNVREVWLSDAEQLTVLEATGVALDDLNRWTLHPALLDQSTFILSGPVRGYLPMGYSRILVRERLPERLSVHRYFRDSGTPEVRTDDFTIVDDAGRELVAVTEFMVRRLDSVGLPAGSAPHKTPAGATAAAVGVVAGRDDATELWMSPADGAEAFHRALAAPLGGHVLIAPTPLTDLTARARSRAAGRGAIDVGAPERRQARTLADGYVAPRTPTERVVAEICGAILGVTDVGADDDFFDLSGNSLVAVHLTSHLRKATGVTLPMRALFETRTVAGIAAWLDSQRTGADVEAAPAGAATTIPRLARRSE
ncbi:MAG TPA: SDR family NAD(P)-dependent oxidoreductase, partial [Pilimelia sp.]|nr:SDR family NAD(P)-dependent oxidoreductase [Pilimelia sp.]